MRSSTLLAVSAAALLSALSAAAAAQTPRSQPGYEYHFDDDALLGDTLDSPPPLLKLRPHPPRVTLIRPRVSFVAELFGSVEAM